MRLGKALRGLAVPTCELREVGGGRLGDLMVQEEWRMDGTVSANAGSLRGLNKETCHLLCEGKLPRNHQDFSMKSGGKI